MYEHRIIVSNYCLPPVITSKQETPFLIIQLTSTVEYPTDPPSCRYTNIFLVFQRNTIQLQFFPPLNISLSIIIIWYMRWFLVSFQNMFRPSITISGNSSLLKDVQKAILANAIVDSSSFFSSSEFDFDQSSSEISPIKRSWLAVSYSSFLITTPILRFAPSMNTENHLHAVGAVDSYNFLSFSE